MNCRIRCALAGLDFAGIGAPIAVAVRAIGKQKALEAPFFDGFARRRRPFDRIAVPGYVGIVRRDRLLETASRHDGWAIQCRCFHDHRTL